MAQPELLAVLYNFSLTFREASGFFSHPISRMTCNACIVPGAISGLLLSRGEGGRGFWTQNLVYQKWPDQIFPVVNFVFSHYGHFGLGRGGGGFGGGVPPPLVFNYSKEALGNIGTPPPKEQYPAPLGSTGTSASANQILPRNDRALPPPVTPPLTLE